tara:strand:+ start:81 stop:716 length:636 start_codon:yes stop_codon:yes gene_type:complete
MKKFDFNTIKNFDEHIEKSIPNYNNLINCVLSMSEYFITKDTIIYDLGCSTGKFLKLIKYNNLKIGYDESKLLPIYDDKIEFKNVDLNYNFEIKNASIVYSIFTMQFLNRNARKNFLKTIYNGLNNGGAFILCEKIYQENGQLQEILAFSHYDYKRKNFKSEEILSKEFDLRHIMKPNTLSENIKLLEEVGFKKITQFWQSYNFIGLIAVK